MQYTQQEAHFLIPSEFYPVHCAGWKVISRVSAGEDLQGPESGDVVLSLVSCMGLGSSGLLSHG